MVKKNKTKKKIFDKNNYNSNNGFLTTIWGPPLWHCLHIISFNYPINPTQKEKQNYKNFILSVKHILPCNICRINFNKNLKELPLTSSVMKNRYTFSNYIYNLHEIVNKMLGKKSNLSYNDVRDRYENFRAHCNYREYKKKENGCINPLYGIKSKCILKIIPFTKNIETIQINNKCKKKRLFTLNNKNKVKKLNTKTTKIR